MKDTQTAEAGKPLTKGSLEEGKVKDTAEIGNDAPVSNEKSSEVTEGDGTHV